MFLTCKRNKGKCGCVGQRFEIHHYERRIKRVLEKIDESSISQRNKKLILGYYRDRMSSGLSKPRQYKYLYTLERLARVFKDDFENANKDSIMNLVSYFENGHYSDWSKHDYKVILKIFFRWLRKTEEYPAEVKWIKTTFRQSHILPEEVLTEEEVKRMAENAVNLRDKALILVLYESGCRIGEILTLRIKNVQFDEYGAVLIVRGKTGDRRVRIVASAPKLASWLENHPLKIDPDSPLWVNFSSNNHYGNLGYNAAKEMLRDTAKRAEVNKRIYPHLFRHSRATFLARHLTEAQLKQHFGWVQSSDMASTYVHLSGRDVDSALFKLQGIKVECNETQTALKTINCPRCTQNNSPDSKFCMRCGSPIDLKTALKLDETRTKADKLLSILIGDPEVMDKILSKLEGVQT